MGLNVNFVVSVNSLRARNLPFFCHLTIRLEEIKAFRNTISAKQFGSWTQFLSVKMYIFSCPSVSIYVLGAQKNRLVETVLLSTHNVCFD